MNQSLLRVFNFIAAFFLGVAFFWSTWMWIESLRSQTGHLEKPAPSSVQIRNPFVQSEEAYQKAQETLLALDRPPPQLTMPDLIKILTYTGSNARPDANPENKAYYLQIKGDVEPHRLQLETPAYLAFDVDQEPPRYIWSLSNKPTRLWLEAKGAEEELLVEVHLRGLDKEQIGHLSLKEQPRPQGKADQWMLGALRVDGTLLARQKARWFGKDQFFLDHGGEEYAHLLERQRIDFQDGETPYSCWLSAEECLAWDGKRWQQADLGNGSSRDKPLLCVKSLGDKVMSLTLWDVGGSRKASLNLIKSNEIWQSQVVEKEFRFVGARTRTQSVMEIRGKRTTLRLYDWLLFTDGEWRKLSTEKEIDDYVSRRVVGPLFVFEGLEKIDGVHWLQATLYNSSRTAKETLLFSAQQRKKGSEPPRPGIPESKEPIPHPFPDPEGIPFQDQVTTPGIRGVVPPQELKINEDRDIP